MTTQYTSILKLALPVQGELSGTWGDVVNDNITSMVEEAVAGRAVINTWTTNSHVLTTADGTTSESRCAMLEFTDTGAALTGAATVVCPNASKLYVCKNDSGQQVTIQTAAGTGVAIPDGQTMFVFCDGTNVEQCETNFNSLSFNGYTLNFGGAVTTAGAFTTSGAYALTLTTTGATNVTLPTTGTLATLDGTETLTNKTLTAPTISSPTLTGSISATDLTISGNTTIGDASADTLTVNATITSNLLFTDNTYDIGATGATRPRDLFLSRNAVLGGTLVTTGNVTLGADTNNVGSFSINTDKFTVASATGNTLVAGTLGVTGITTATGGLNVDTISEITSAAGVAVDSVVLKDGTAGRADASGTDAAGNDLTLKGGASTGAGAGGSLIFKTTPAGSTGSSVNAQVTALTIDGEGDASFAGDVTVTSDNFTVDGSSGKITVKSFQPKLIFDDDSAGGAGSDKLIIQSVAAQTAGDYEFVINNDNTSSADQVAITLKGIGDIAFHSTSKTNALYVDYSSDFIGIGESAPNRPLHITNAVPAIRLEDTDVSGLFTDLVQLSSGEFSFRVDHGDVQAGSSLSFYVDGQTLINLDTSSFIFNEGGQDRDFRVESSNNTHAFFVNGGDNLNGMYTANPVAELSVNGSISTTGIYDGAYMFTPYEVPSVSVASNSPRYILLCRTGSSGRFVNGTFYGNRSTASSATRAQQYEVQVAVNSSGNVQHANLVTKGYSPDSNVKLVNITYDSITYIALHVSDTTSSAYPTGYNFIGTCSSWTEIKAIDASLGSSESDYTSVTGFTGVRNQNFIVYDGDVIFNQNSTNSDFRVESSGDENMLFVDGANNRVGVGTASPDVRFHVSSATTDIAKLTTESTTVGPNFLFANTDGTLARLASAETNTLRIETGTSNTEMARFVEASGAVFNEGSAAALDFRVESDGNSNMLFVDAGNDRIGVGLNSPDCTLEVNGEFGLTETTANTWSRRYHFRHTNTGGTGATVSFAFGSGSSNSLSFKLHITVYSGYSGVSSTTGVFINGLASMNTANTVSCEVGDIDVVGLPNTYGVTVTPSSTGTTATVNISSASTSAGNDIWVVAVDLVSGNANEPTVSLGN